MTNLPDQHDTPPEPSQTRAPVAYYQPREIRPWWQHPVAKALLWGICVVFVLFLIATAVTALTVINTTNDITNSFDSMVQMDALKAAGVFGDGANSQLIARVNAVTTAIKNNLLGFIGAVVIIAIVSLAGAHMFGNPRAQEKTAGFVVGVLGLAAATGFVA